MPNADVNPKDAGQRQNSKPGDRDTVYDPADVRRQVDGSLRALRTDYVDVNQFHSSSDAEFEAWPRPCST